MGSNALKSVILQTQFSHLVLVFVKYGLFFHVKKPKITLLMNTFVKSMLFFSDEIKRSMCEREAKGKKAINRQWGKEWNFP